MRMRSMIAVSCCTLALSGVAAGDGMYAPDQRTPGGPSGRAALVRQLKLERARHAAELRAARVRYVPDVQKALTIAAVTFGVDRERMAAITWRESRWRPWAKNPSSTAGGIAQFLSSTWANTPCGKAGLSRFDPYAAAMCMAWTVRYGAGWSPWKT